VKSPDEQLTTRVQAKCPDELFAVIQKEDLPFHRTPEIVLRREGFEERVFE
jgi:hypothetical protein